MGQILSNPVIDKEHHFGTDGFTSFGLCSMQGWRVTMEDAHSVELNVSSNSSDSVACYGVFDGHSGAGVAEFCGKYFADILKKQEKFQAGDLPNGLISAFISVDEHLIKESLFQNEHSGCTATCVLISKAQKIIVCGNAGDSRTVLSTEGYAKALSYDHKPYLIAERSRIVAAGNYVEIGRVNGNLALSRAIGDFDFKTNKELHYSEQAVTCVPDIIRKNLDYDKDEFIILACDGIWDCLTSQECVDMVHYGIKTGTMSLTEIASRIIDVCCAPTNDGTEIGCDNMSIVIVALLSEGETEEEWFNRIKMKGKSVRHSFEEQRKKLFDYYPFSVDDDTSVFDITTKQPYEKFRETSDASNCMDIDDTDEDKQPEISELSDNSNDFISLENLVQSNGIRISHDSSSNSYIHGSALSELLALKKHQEGSGS